MTASGESRRLLPETAMADRAPGVPCARPDGRRQPVDDDFWRDARAVMLIGTTQVLAN